LRVPARPARHGVRRLQRGSPTGHEFGGLQCRHGIESRRPVLEVAVARVGSGIELDQVAAEQDPLGREPHDGVALGMAPAELHDLHLERAEPQRERALEDHVRPVRPGTDSAARNSRGKRSISLFMSASPRSAIRS